MRDRLTGWRKAVADGIEAAWDQVPELTLASDVEVPIYVIHDGQGAEDYALLCDFEAFLRESKSGLFHRPVLSVWAGRDDFERVVFARHLREAFTHQFDLVRDAHRAEAEAAQRRWSLRLPGLGEILLWGWGATGGLIGVLLLYVATAATGDALREIGQVLRNSILGRAVRGKDPDEALEEMIAEKRGVIDAALARQSVTLHPELYAHAWRGQRPGPMTGMDREAWPLPAFVRDRMGV